MNQKIRQDIVKNQAAVAENYQNLSSILRDKLAWFQDQKLGVLIHWGLYSQAGIIESWQLSKEDTWARKNGAWRADLQTLRHDYWNLNHDFNPVFFDPQDWAQQLKAAGFKYTLFTTKHHDGFNMYDTKFSDYKITADDSAFAKNPYADVFKHLNQAFRQVGLATGAYYSKADWHSEDYWLPGSNPRGRYASYDPQTDPKHWQRFNNYVQNQLVEICQDYGSIDILWLDGGWVNSQNHEQLDMDQIVTQIRTIKPDTLIVDRTIGGQYENYVTPEQQIPDIAPKKVWESNLTLAQNWGYVPHDKYKSFAEILDSIVKIITLGGNVVLGIGPKPDGTFPVEAQKIMQQLGAWLQVFGEAVYETRAGAVAPLLCTKKNHTLYLFFKQQSVGQKLNLSRLLTHSSQVLVLETKQFITVQQGQIILPVTKFPYGVLKIE
ncbi:alpha-L-fucosidase [Bombilactobacillus folatiphilus]|uniref:alpha-L-fucosidase n=1 Tax=Bombilactobacillus folatiphilus TaxID=2923362 RepID=A0ABY4PAU8_9LACO|nr:alpha-L-fucosidase [Bombilactobacillus folatiphilus]UQS82802.1 alpha-L-fucosidase [Bombilactobacillus folatiphilus]